ncbi:hypothetical protein [Kosakonia sp.]|uniref:hypothetical protein n=1 Tax=Kosakonia sp. TaxID=1916651 RepID=UPI0028A091CF|nr:hypothetical protein [Kosakonia sp.]
MAMFVSGCYNNLINKDLSPPADTKWFNIEIKNPLQYTKPFPPEVRYISQICLKKRVSGFDGSVISEPGYNVIKIPIQQESNDIWKAKVAITGGGYCKWTLSAVSLGIKYTDATHLGKELVPGSAVGLIIALDNDASRNGQYDSFSGNFFSYSPKYYPVIERWSSQNKGPHADKLNLFGKEQSFWKITLYSSNKEISIKYLPSIDEERKVEMIFPYKKNKKSSYTFIYPNGDREQSKNTKPDFKKVEVKTKPQKSFSAKVIDY